MKEYKIGELFQWQDRTLMCVEWDDNSDCDKCSTDLNCAEFNCTHYKRTDDKSAYFTNKLIFTAEGLTLQVKRKGRKVKVKVLEIGDSNINIGRGHIVSHLLYTKICTKDNSFPNGYLLINRGQLKTSHTFPTDQEAIDWVEGLFSLRGE